MAAQSRGSVKVLVQPLNESLLAAKLVNELVEAADERQLSRTIARYGRVELLCLDELGYLELDKRGAELLFPGPHRTGREDRRRHRGQHVTHRVAGLGGGGPEPDE